jgi:hypothetical protein
MIVAVSRAYRRTAQGDVYRLVRCIREQWEAVGVEDGEVRIFWDL